MTVPYDTKVELAKLARAARSGVLSIENAAEALGTSRRKAAARVAALIRAGWLARVRRGLYLIVPLEAVSGSVTTVEDPWILAAALYAPCYIAGWSAAEHWGMTEQLFRTTFVATAADIRERSATYLGASFTLVRVKSQRLTRLATAWRGSMRVSVSSRERTLVDAAIDPRWVGGVRHLADILATYADTGDQSALLTELTRCGTGAAAKRIGYLAEHLWPDAQALIEGAHSMATRGVIKLDPAIGRRGSMSSRWGLWLNVAIGASTGHEKRRSTRGER